MIPPTTTRRVLGTTMPMPNMIAGRYRVVRPLGRGGMGAVFVVEHVNTGERLALKVMLSGTDDPDLIERFRREARASAQIATEHVVRVIDADTAPELDGQPFLVMELLDGSDLARVIDERGRLSPELVVDYLSQAAIAIERAHAAGIVHRDLKPENLFLHRTVDGKQIVKVLDFGIARVLNPETTAVTQPGAIVGTPFYMAPEQARGDVHGVGPHTDIWAIGMIALELLVAEGYWKAATSTAALLVDIIKGAQTAPSTRWPFLPKDLDAWFFRSCAKDPKERFASVREQIDALRMVLSPNTARTLPFEPTVPTPAVAPTLGALAVDRSAPTAVGEERSDADVDRGFVGRAPKGVDAAPLSEEATTERAPLIRNEGGQGQLGRPQPQVSGPPRPAVSHPPLPMRPPMGMPPMRMAPPRAPRATARPAFSSPLVLILVGVAGALLVVSILIARAKRRRAEPEPETVDVTHLPDKRPLSTQVPPPLPTQAPPLLPAPYDPLDPSRARPPIGKGKITVVCFPECDDIIDNGVSLGPIVQQREVPAGHHVIRAKKNMLVKETGFNLNPGGAHTVRLDMSMGSRD